MILMEYVLKLDKGAGNLLTVTELGFVTAQQLLLKRDMPNKIGNKRLLPWRHHALHAGLWLSMTILVNVVFDFNIAVPIHTLFRSCNIVSSVVVGYYFFNTLYTKAEIFATYMITLGIFLGSIGDMKTITSNCCTGPPWESANGEAAATRWSIGIGILTAVLFIQAFLGHIQDRYYRMYSSSTVSRKALADEFMLYSHIAALLPMAFLSSNLKEHWDILVATTPAFTLFNIQIPIGILMVLLNNITQSVCISGVFALSASCSPLTVNITLSARKFLTVMVSIYWFSNPWTWMHSIALVLVFGGVGLYASVKRDGRSGIEK
ncbi:hypothetical protein FOZ62_022785 [Perkinsus olseni]|uniref:Uncharacterized protein n=1 Tax=Perkinsus olseni TaxID=32597 RepID=A0A7J6R7H4_PEROL|nr:hypothetical protein FOZ62_022785 [Perkinsus olseni]